MMTVCFVSTTSEKFINRLVDQFGKRDTFRTSTGIFVAFTDSADHATELVLSIMCDDDEKYDDALVFVVKGLGSINNELAYQWFKDKTMEYQNSTPDSIWKWTEFKE